MCGITGFWSPDMRAGISADVLRRMTGTLAHRGPDADGYFIDDASGVSLGHRRLSIVDLSPEGAQPMTSASGRYIVVFNGEIYNFRTLRAELESAGVTGWRGHSDTEVMLAAFERWGVRDATSRFAGMFAFALWDKNERVLHLVRDRLGIKPLYYGWSRGTLLFGSELKALREHPAFERPLDLYAVASFLRYDYIPGPASIYEDIHKLPPGTILSVRAAGEQAEPASYWSPQDIADRGRSHRFAGTPEAGVDALHALLRTVVSEHMVADVPLGAFLSGGIDSSTIVALMQEQSGQAVRTFAIGFDDPRFNEAPHARAVAQRLGTQHTELIVTADDMLSVVPKLPTMYDEPFADSSQVPTYLVSALTRNSVTVSLSGDGGDELFGGYTRYGWTSDMWARLSRAPQFARSGANTAIQALPEAALDAMLAPMRWLGPTRLRGHARGARLQRLSSYVGVRSPEALYDRVMSHVDPRQAMAAARARDGQVWRTVRGGSARERMMLWDLMSYLPDDILVKVDRASMAVSLETRVPLLDHRVVELAWSLPEMHRIRDGVTKWPLRQILGRYLPLSLFDRPKSGFSIPISAWLRGPLKAWAGDLLSPARLRRSGLLNERFVQRRWADHQTGRGEYGWALWNMVTLEAWLEAQRSDS